MLTQLPRILITAPKSSAGKTTLTCTLMGALRERGLRMLACKCGPDYVDPTFHERLGAVRRLNLDAFFQSETLMRDLLAHAGRDCDIACIEGAMGYYDGVGTTTKASAWDVAHITESPALLVLDARGACASLAAQALGFVAMRTPSHVAGVVLDHASAALADKVAPVIAVARDEAFCFYYAEELELLEDLGAALAFFSPLRDEGLPKGASGLFLGGGYPELHVHELSSNTAMRKAVRTALAQGMPAIAECGGFLYLLERLTDDNGATWPLVGACPGGAERKKHGRFGYIELETQGAGLLGPTGTTLRAHEFHRWEADDTGAGLLARKPESERFWYAGHHTPGLYAGFPHLYLPGSIDVARRFVRACAAWGAQRKDAACTCTL